MPEKLSDQARDLFRLHVERQGNINVDEDNRGSYYELEQAGLVLLGRPFTGAPRYHLTQQGYEAKLQLVAEGTQEAI